VNDALGSSDFAAICHYGVWCWSILLGKWL